MRAGVRGHRITPHSLTPLESGVHGQTEHTTNLENLKPTRAWIPRCPGICETII